MSGHQEKVHKSSHLVLHDDDWEEKLDADHLSNSMICAPYDDLEDAKELVELSICEPSYDDDDSMMFNLQCAAPRYNYVEKLEPEPVSNSMILVPSYDDDLEIFRKEQVEDKPLFSTSIEVRARGQSSKFLNIAWSRVFPSSKKIEKEEYAKCMQESFCSKLPSSTYGYLINDLLSQEIHKINFKQHSSAAVVVAFQLTMVLYLWNSSQLNFTLIESAPIIPLQIAGIGVLLLNLIPSVTDIILEIAAILFSDFYFVDLEAEGEGILKVDMLGKENGGIWSLFWLWVVVAFESIVFLSVLVVGITYILSSTSASELVQACLSIVFINEIDNVAFNNLMLDCSRDFFAKQLFHFQCFIPSSAQTLLMRFDRKNPTMQFRLRTLFDSWSGVILLVLSVGIVFCWYH